MSVQLPATGANIATDLVGADNYQLVKLAVGGPGSAAQISAQNPIPVVSNNDALIEAIEAIAPLSTQPVSLAAIPLAAGAATAALQTAGNTAIAKVGTRAYGAGISALSITTSNAESAAVAAEEVTLHNRSGGSLCFVRAGAPATVNDIPLEPGEKFTMRITSGQTINAIAATGAATLNIIPVA